MLELVVLLRRKVIKQLRKRLLNILAIILIWDIAKTTGWRPTCDCGLDPISCTVLDPFVGSGTTLLEATKLGRKSIGYDISESYCKMAVNRNSQKAL